jgi:hypothetical protein
MYVMTLLLNEMYLNLFITKGYSSYTGSSCETALCYIPDPDICSSYSTLNCVAYSIFYTCPRFCGVCKDVITTITTITTTTTCISLTCINGGTFDLSTCSCLCNHTEIYLNNNMIFNFILLKAIQVTLVYHVKLYYVRMQIQLFAVPTPD